MNYELAKELKDAGWPQFGSPYVYKNGKCGHRLYEETDEYPEEHKKDCFAHIPTLSELIEACGETVTISRIRFADGFKWTASANGIEFMDDDGATAVARLWLALNKK